MNPFQGHLSFILRQSNNDKLNSAFRIRYPLLPTDYEDFLHSFSVLTNTSDTTWFNSIIDFNETNSDSGFKWNEFELLSLEVFDGDSENQEIVRDFWNKHLPIILSVKNNYAFFAIGVSSKNFGEIYFGQEPEFEEVELVENDFTSFIKSLRQGSLNSEFLDLF
ncbi:SMI1/KNR4 family protein [Empedobacter falsenii]|uniref:hypothetical protein n=1 Tax=Empedobacter falsenii TaxID=343874 RepID=UPI002574FEAD|nr:hypothetical protein [Empedobacter falsenii]MDM1298319.1 SMI1/KNR4 family protein [Empedobacter falsenii]MDM1318124.1 SMI1/KNR4 family protein [Empedobacter falsenii]